jgi:glycosyltransferase involved in cell wall biosynthesis
LQLGTYPVKEPQHGGQRRAAAIRAAYRAAGIETEYLAVYNPVGYPPVTAARQDIPAGPATLARIATSPWLEDLFVGECLLHDADCRERFLKFYRAFRPDVVALEQPYLWSSLGTFLKDGSLPWPRIVHSSQNVESVMKADIYARVLPTGKAETAAAKVREVEDDLTRNCDVLVAVTDSDAQRLLRGIAKPCVLLRNGGDVRKASERALRKWRAALAGHKTRRAFFVGSMHPPNGDGFIEMLGTALGYLPPDSEILVAGGVCELLEKSDLVTGPLAGVNAARVRLLERQPDDDLVALIEMSDVVLLPITSGGGSNLKTVEALLSGKPIVGTSYAFRAYEDFLGGAAVTVADDPVAFRMAVVRALADPTAVRPPDGWHNRLQALTWTELGRKFVPELLARLTEQRHLIAA